MRADGASRAVFGLMLAGSLLVLIEGLVELGVPISVQLPGVGYAFAAVAGVTIAIGLILILLTVLYSMGESGALGVLIIVSGAISFLVGAGFIVGGVLVIVGGALAMVVEPIQDQLDERPVSAHAAKPSANPLRVPNEATKALGDGHRESTPSAVASSAESDGLRIYQQCPTCGELNLPGTKVCGRCRATLPNRP